jgi:hypothetical protein
MHLLVFTHVLTKCTVQEAKLRLLAYKAETCPQTECKQLCLLITLRLTVKSFLLIGHSPS